jgi:hypothetical protein
MWDVSPKHWHLSAGHHITVDFNPRSHRHENLKSHIEIFFLFFADFPRLVPFRAPQSGEEICGT